MAGNCFSAKGYLNTSWRSCPSNTSIGQANLGPNPKGHILRLFLLIGCLITAGLGVLFWTLKPSAGDHLIQVLTEVTGSDGAAALDSCNLSIVVETAGQAGAPIALIRVEIHADLRNYNFETVRFVPRSNGLILRIERGPVTESMLDQVADIVSAGGQVTEQLFSDPNAAKELLELEGGSLFFRVMAEVVTAEDGTTELIPHDDAPDFFRFAESVGAIPAPASYHTTTTFAPGAASAATLLTGEVMAIPFLQFTVGSEDQGKTLAHAFHSYVDENNCN
jgi:hypothetical protein